MWLKTSGFAPRPLSGAPTNIDDVHTPDAKPKITVEKLEDLGESYKFTLSINSRYLIKEVDVTVLDSLIASSQNIQDGEVTVEIRKNLLGNPPSPVIFKAYDSVGNSSEIALPFGT